MCVCVCVRVRVRGGLQVEGAIQACMFSTSMDVPANVTKVLYDDPEVRPEPYPGPCLRPYLGLYVGLYLGLYLAPI